MTKQEIIRFIAYNNPEGVKTLLVSTGWPSFAPTPSNAESNLNAYEAGGGDLQIFASLPYLNGTPNFTGGLFNSAAKNSFLGDVNFGQILGGMLSGIGGALSSQGNSEQQNGNGLPISVQTDEATKKTLKTIQTAFICFIAISVIIAAFVVFKKK